MEQQTAEKVWDKAAIQALLDRNDDAVAKAVLTIFARQTAAEQASRQTIEHNGVGFSGTDAEFLSDIAKKLPLYNNRMTPRQIAKVRPKMKKYWRQLLQEVETKGGKVCYKVAKSTKGEIANSPVRESAQPRLSDTAAPAGYGAW